MPVPQSLSNSSQHLIGHTYKQMLSMHILKNHLGLICFFGIRTRDETEGFLWQMGFILNHKPCYNSSQIRSIGCTHDVTCSTYAAS